MTGAEYHQESFNCYFCCLFFGVYLFLEQQYLFLSQVSGLQSQVFGHPSSVEYMYHLVEWFLSSIRLVSHFYKLCDCYSYLAARTSLQNKMRMVGLVFTLLSWQLQQGRQQVRVKTLCRHYFDFSMSNEICKCFQQWNFALGCGEQPQPQPGLFGNSHGIPLPNNSVRYNPIPSPRSFVWSLMSVWAVFLNMYIFQEDFTVLGFHIVTQMALNFCLFLLSVPLSSPSPYNFTASNPSTVIHSISRAY